MEAMVVRYGDAEFRCYENVVLSAGFERDMIARARTMASCVRAVQGVEFARTGDTNMGGGSWTNTREVRRDYKTGWSGEGCKFRGAR
jgi:hypothetical protein